MSKPHVIVLQHVACEGPGIIEDALSSRGLYTKVIRIHEGQVVPGRIRGASGLVIMGGPMGVYETGRFPHLRAEMKLIEAAMREAIPILGVCLGSQLLAATLGAHVYPGTRKEIGWYDIRVSDAAKADTLFRGTADSFTAFHWHGDVFELPQGAVSLASSKITEHQGFRYGNSAYGLLFHLEVKRSQIDTIVRTFHEELLGAGIDSEPILADADAHISQLMEVGSLIFGGWTELASSPSREAVVQRQL